MCDFFYDGHFLDDPLFVINVDIDFLNLGLDPIKYLNYEVQE